MVLTIYHTTTYHSSVVECLTEDPTAIIFMLKVSGYNFILHPEASISTKYESVWEKAILKATRWIDDSEKLLTAIIVTNEVNASMDEMLSEHYLHLLKTDLHQLEDHEIKNIQWGDLEERLFAVVVVKKPDDDFSHYILIPQGKDEKFLTGVHALSEKINGNKVCIYILETPVFQIEQFQNHKESLKRDYFKHAQFIADEQLYDLNIFLDRMHELVIREYYLPSSSLN